MVSFKELEIGKVALIQQREDGRIVQIGMTIEQSEMLQLFLASLSQESKLIQMPEQYDLILKSNS